MHSRILSAVYGVTVFLVSGILAGIGRLNPIFAGLFALAITFQIVASLALLLAHAAAKRNPLEPLALVCYPSVAWLGLHGFASFGNRAFWIFQGYFLFIVLTGGFLLGIFLAPCLACRSGASREEVMRKVRFGAEFTRRLNFSLFTWLAFTGIFIALAWISSSFFLRLEALGAEKKVLFLLFLLPAMLLVINFTYRNTIFAKEGRQS